MGEGDKAGSQPGERPLAGIAANAASFMLAAGGDALTKVAVTDAPLAQTIALRSIFLLALFAPVFLMSMRKGRPVLATARPTLHLARVMLHLGATVTGFAALRYLPLTTFTAIVFIAPVFIALGAVPVLGERIKPHQWGAIALGFIGCMVIVRPRGEGEVAFMLLALASSASWALSVILLRKLTRTESRVTLIAWGNFPPMILGGAVAAFDWRQIEPSILLVVAAMAVFQVVGQLLSMTALKLAPAATVAPAQYTQILWATLIGMLFFNEWPQATIWLGAALIMVGGYWLMRSERAA
ncbi:DMT family transporter [Terrarubrum flagellatum]|uniref:DMT family transporter n=1 Tax=Terrirubrum flagellatum TaxID=2895980 RepID=UPI003144FA7E